MITENIRKIVLDNGVRILFERIPYLRSASIGVYFDVGSRNETTTESGMTHFIEHMLFKGTQRFDALTLSQEINRVGGNVNAWTTQEHVAVTAKVVDEHIARTIELLFDMVNDSIFAPEEIDRERNVILEEVKMYDDTPDELVIDVFMDQLYEGNALGQPILGSTANIERFNREELCAYARRELSTDRMVVAIAGNFDLRRVEPQLRRLFGSIAPTTPAAHNPVATPRPAYRSRNINRRLEQVYFCLGGDAPHRTSEDRFAFTLLNTIVGAGGSSRIFHEVREKRGLAYSIGTFDVMFKDCGCFAVSGGTSPANVGKVVDLSLAEVKRAYTEPVSADELESAREQVKSSILLGMESSSYRMSRLAETEITFGEYVPLNTALDRYRNVTIDDVRTVAEKYLRDKEVTFASVAPDKKVEKYLTGMRF